MSYFQIWKDTADEFRLTLRGDNHEIIFTTEGYTRKESALKARDIIAATDPQTPVSDQT